ncbi:MAG: hypothetical protein H0T89_21405 [Deltaproteobacteria bacterium]|nr:hypothetical protein [Deltaproteobacteria bacterium]
MQRDNLRVVAERLLHYEAVVENPETAAFRVSEKLRHLVLSTLLGGAGFRALLARALHLAKGRAPELSAVEVKTDGSLAGLSKVLRHSRSTPMANGEVMLITELLVLLDTYIGEALMLRLVQDVWPKATLGALKEEESDE